MLVTTGFPTTDKVQVRKEGGGVGGAVTQYARFAYINLSNYFHSLQFSSVV